VKVRLSNTDPRRSKEVVQVYVSRPHSGIKRPVRWLAGFTAVDAEPGEHVTATVAVNPRAFEHWDVDTRQWAVEPGPFELSASRGGAAQ
jgi:beta-glucosidase